MTTEDATSTNIHSKVLMEQLLAEQKDGKFCDLLVQVGEKEFPCHRNVLAISCSYFARLLDSDFEDSRAPKITLSDMEADVFANVLEYFYSGVARINDENAYEMLRTGNFLGSSKLEDTCKRYIMAEKNVENLIDIYHFAYHPLNDENFRRRVTLHVVARFNELILLNNFYQITFEMLKNVLLGLTASLPSRVSYVKCIYCNIPRAHTEPKHRDDKLAAIILPVIIKWVKTDTKIRLAYFKELCQSTNLLFDSLDLWQTVLQNSCAKSVHETDVPTFEPDKYHVKIFVQNVNVIDSIRWHKQDCWIPDKGYNVNFESLKTITVKNEVFYLAYDANGENKFMTRDTDLQPPPVLVSDFHLAASNTGSVYLYNSGECLSRIYGVLSYVDFSKETSVNNVYCYNTDLNKWFALPLIPHYVYNGYFVSANNSIYVIGGSTRYWETESESNCNIIQIYDPRCYKWRCAKTDPHKFSLMGAACADQNKIYIYEKTPSSGANTKKLYVFDTVAGKWQTQVVRNDQSSIAALVANQNQLWAFPLFTNHVGSIYDVKSRGWGNMPSFSQLSKPGVILDAAVLP